MILTKYLIVNALKLKPCFHYCAVANVNNFGITRKIESKVPKIRDKSIDS